MRSIIFSILVSSLALVTGGAASTFDETAHWAWSGNAGWISFRHNQPAAPAGVSVGETVLSGFAWSPNIGWINFGSGRPANGHTYANTGTDHGVNRGPGGRLSGFAWSANTGWINFGWAGDAEFEPDRPQVNGLTGEFSGYAWSANLGWINLGTGLLATRTIAVVDEDGDGMSDHWEHLHFGGLAVAGLATDADGDGVSDRDEYQADTDPGDAQDFLQIFQHTYNGALNEATLDFTISGARLYRIEMSTGLGTSGPWVDSGLGLITPSADAIQIAIPYGRFLSRTFGFPAGPWRFFRVVALKPLAP